jgi:hypothetical protein
VTEQDGFWPGGARLAVTVSMQFEAGGRAVYGAPERHRKLRLPGFNPAACEQQMIDEFDQLYAEGGTRRDPAPVSGLPGRSA